MKEGSIMLTCHDIAKYFLSLINEESEELMSNLKLQKLVYYAQGFHLALYGRVLFKEEIEAWTHGPVIKELYEEYKDYGASGIPLQKIENDDKYTPEVKELLNEIHSVFGQFSAWKLRNMTHEEPPWKDAYESTSGIVSTESMKEYFKTQIKDE